MNHFLIEVERDCADLRREIAQGKTLVERQSEISSYVKSTAMKLTDVATSRLRLSDELKKRILTTLLTLMNLHESLDRSANRTTPVREMRPLIVPA
jgi:CRISPR/Cas system-associated protein Cas7 (RAMP superfamily)